MTSLRDAFLPWYQQQYGQPYAWSAREGKHAKAALAKAGEGGVEAVMRKVRAGALEDWRTSPITLGMVESQWNSMGVTARAGAKPVQAGPSILARMAAGELP